MSEILKQIREDLKVAMTGEVQFRKKNIKEGEAWAQIRSFPKYFVGS